MNQQPKLLRVSAVPVSMNLLLKGQLKFLSKYYEVIGVCSPGKEVEEICIREGIQVKTVKISRKINIWKDLKSLYQLFVLFRKEKPIIIHSITPKAGLLSMIAGKIAGVPIRMHTFTGLIFPYRTGLFQKLLINTERLLCLCATHLYPEGEGVKKDLIKYRITNKPLKIIANGNVNGIDCDYFKPDAFSQAYYRSVVHSLNLENKFIFTFIGRINRDKGVNELVSSFNKLSLTYKNIVLLLLGDKEKDCPIEPASEKIIENNEDIIDLGFQKDIRPFLGVSTILVLPSYREGFPNVVLQAGAMGIPCLVSDVSGCNEIITHEKNGIIIPPKDEDALYRSMELFINDRELVRKLAKNSRKTIIERYEQRNVWAQQLAEYRELGELLIKK